MKDGYNRSRVGIVGAGVSAGTMLKVGHGLARLLSLVWAAWILICVMLFAILLSVVALGHFPLWGDFVFLVAAALLAAVPWAFWRWFMRHVEDRDGAGA